jgi:hypothetical protein
MQRRQVFHRRAQINGEKRGASLKNNCVVGTAIPGRVLAGRATVAALGYYHVVPRGLFPNAECGHERRGG